MDLADFYYEPPSVGMRAEQKQKMRDMKTLKLEMGAQGSSSTTQKVFSKLKQQKDKAKQSEKERKTQ